LTLDKCLTWSPHIKLKCKTINSRLFLLRPLLKSKLSLSNKLIIYKSIIWPVRSYGIQLLASAKPSSTKTLQAFQSIYLRLITFCPWYFTNYNLHKDLKIPTLYELANLYYLELHSKSNSRNNPLIKKLSYISFLSNVRRRLKRQWLKDLLKFFFNNR